MRALVRTMAFALLLPLGIMNSSALDLSLKAQAEVGIDPATREFLATLLDDWKPQIEEILDGAMNRADRSVETYISAVDKLITNKLAELTCTQAAMAKTTADEVRRLFPWVGEKDPVADLKRKVSEDRRSVRGEATPAEVKTMYADDAYATGVVGCQTLFIDVTNAEVRELLALLKQKWLLWNRVVATGCKSTITNCAVAYKEHVQRGLEESDVRDVSEAARAHLAAYSPPQPPGFLRQHDLNAVEVNLEELADIEDAYLAARAIREANGITALIGARPKIDEAAALLEKWRPRFEHITQLFNINSDCAVTLNAFGADVDFAGAAVRLADAGVLLQQSRELMAELADDVSAEQQRVDALSQRVGTLQASCR